MTVANLSKRKIQKLREKPSLFVEKVLNDPLSSQDISPYQYQEEFLDNDNERKVIVAGRQCGKTTMMAWLALHEFTMYPNRRILIVAPTKRQAKNFMRKLKAEIKHWLRNEDDYGLETVQKMRIEGQNGSWIQAVPALEETIRGLTIDSAFVDEAAFIEREIFTSVISPMLATTDGQFVLGSTPWGKEGYLYKKYEKDNYWYSQRVASMENPEIDARQVDEWRRDMTSTEFEREVLGMFSEKKNAFFSNKDINRCLEWNAEHEDGENVIYPDRKGRDCYMGIDPATGGDDSAVITTVDTEGNVFDIKSFGNTTIPKLEGEIRNLLKKNDRNYLSGYMEENGIGEGTVHRFENEFSPVEGFRTTLRSKESTYQKAKNLMQKDKISIPDHERLQSQLRTIEYEMTERGNKKIHAPTGEHDDFADSFVLALACMSGDSFVERQSQTYSFSDSPNSINKKSNKRAFKF
jgi:hypothetical protein